MRVACNVGRWMGNQPSLAAQSHLLLPGHQALMTKARNQIRVSFPRNQAMALGFAPDVNAAGTAVPLLAAKFALLTAAAWLVSRVNRPLMPLVDFRQGILTGQIRWIQTKAQAVESADLLPQQWYQVLGYLDEQVCLQDTLAWIPLGKQAAPQPSGRQFFVPIDALLHITQAVEGPRQS